MTATKIKKELAKFADKDQPKNLARFFKTGKGEYGEGDKFLGIRVPEQRKVAKKYFKDISLAETEKLLHSPIHEHRQTALHILVYKFQKAFESEKKKIYNLYLKNLKYINNWDLVDTSTPYIIGGYLLNKKSERKVLYKLAKSKNLWQKRVAMMGTFAFIRQGDFKDAFSIAEILLHDSHDLIHKAVGWMLREVGNVNRGAEEKFLLKYYREIPRTMLRYAIEKFPEKKRQFYLKK